MKILLSKLANILEKGFVFFVLQLTAHANIIIGGGNGAVNYTEGSATAQVFWLGIYGITLCLIITRWKRFIRIVTADKLLLLLVGIALASVFWSTVPGVTLRRDVALIGTTLFGMYLGTRYSTSELLRILAWTFSIGAFLSLLAGLAIPSYGVVAGLWRGIYLHKNGLGGLMAMNAIILLLIIFSSRRYRWLTGIGICLSLGLLVLSGAKTALVVFLTLVLLLPLYNTLRLNFTLAVPFFIVMLLVGGSVLTLLASNKAIILKMLGKDATLTGRTDIWDIAVEMINRRPLLGYGYGGFWLGLEGKYSAYIWDIVHWDVPNAHNGFIDLGLDLGYLGVSVFLLGFLMIFIRSVKLAHSTKTLEQLWPLEYMSLVFISSTSTSVILMYNDLYWVLYVAIALSTLTLPYRSRVSQTAHLSPISSKGEWVKDV